MKSLMIRRRLFLLPLLLPAGFAARAASQQLVAPPPQAAYESATIPAPVGVQNAGGYPAATVGDRYAVPATFETSLAPRYPAVPAVQTSAASGHVHLVTAEIPSAAENIPQPPAAGPAIPLTPTSVFRLEELVGIATTYNPILQREQARIDDAKGERVQAGLYENPTMFTNNPQIWAGQSSFVNFGFKQNVIVKGKRQIDRAAADQLVRAARPPLRWSGPS
ncbi:MAG: hypothetical protein QM775_33495 [Pirellulales bacterium]